jgi:RNA polymerase sigma-70 factor (ECF subfamily)
MDIQILNAFGETVPIPVLTNSMGAGLSISDVEPMCPPTQSTQAWKNSGNPYTLPQSRAEAIVTDTQQGGDVAGFDAEVKGLVLADRQRQAADLLLTRLSPELRPFLHRLLGDVTLADEALSNTCERLWRGLSAFRWECSLRSWSYIIARREASRCRARHARDDFQQTTLSKADQVAARVGSTSGTFSTTRRDQLDNVRASLSDEDRDLVVLRVERSLAWKEIAAAFLEDDDTSPENVAREAARLRQRFRAIRVKIAAAISDPSPPAPEKP